MEERLERAHKQLTEANAQIKALSEKGNSCLHLTKTVYLLVLSRLTAQQFELKNLSKTCSQFHRQYGQQLSDLGKSFKEYEIKRTKSDGQFMYKIKLIRDQLTVKRLKLRALKKKHDTALKEFTVKEEELKKEAVLRCIRCKARKKVIHSLESEVVQKSKRHGDMEKLIAKLTQENTRLKETVSGQNRDMVEIKSKLQDEMDKNTARSNDPSLVVDVTRTPASSSTASLAPLYTGFEEPQYNTMQTMSMMEDQLRAEKEVNRLQWLVNSKAAELVRVNKQLQDAQVNAEMMNVQVIDLRAELETRGEELEVYKDNCRQMPFVVEQLESRDKQLKEAGAKLNLAHSQVEELRGKNEVLQTLLTNLATSVQTMLN